jgi:6-phosphogluconolactonase
MTVPILGRRALKVWPAALVLLVAAALLAAPAAKAAPPIGVLYAMTNQTVNQIVVLARNANGSLQVLQRVNTGGAGSPSGNPPFPQDHLDADHEIKLTGSLLFAVNAGDNTVSSFRVSPGPPPAGGQLTLVDRKPSGGVHPVSLDTYNGLLYVVNELDPNGHDISGLRYTSTGVMTPIAGSTRPLATPFTLNQPPGFYGEPLPSQIIFSPDGRELVVPERTSNNFQGQLDTFAIASNGTPGPVQVNASNAPIPFGMAWDNNHVIVANAGPPPPPFAMSSASSYSWSGTTLTPIDNESSNASATCWVSITGDGTHAFMSNQLSNDVSRFAISTGGQLTLLPGNAPTTAHAADTALSNDSRYLYVLNVLNANGSGGALIDSYSVGSDGTLVHLATTNPGTAILPDSASGLASN